MQTTYIVYGIFVSLFAGLIAGITAFGFALIAVPLLILFFDPKAAVPIVTINSVMTGMFLYFELRKRMQPKKIIPLIIGGIVGLPFGVYLLAVLDKNILKISVGALITVFSVLLALGIKREIKSEKYTSFLVGLVSGLLKGSTSLSGPPVVLFFINQDQEKEVFRANLTGYFMIMGTLAIIALAIGKLVNLNVLGYSAWFFVPTIIGTWLGSKICPRVNPLPFRNLSLAVVIIAGIISILSGFKVFD
jgi:uncharacterized membrane protein YfcA